MHSGPAAILAGFVILFGAFACSDERLGGEKERLMVTAGPNTERWGDFILSQDRVDGARVVERPGSRRDLTFSEDEGPFDSRFSKFSTDESAARADSRTPLLGTIPTGEQFFGFTIVEDGRGAAEAWVHYLRPELRIINLTEGPRPALPDDASIIVGWTLRQDAPFYIIPLTTPSDLRSPEQRGAAVFLDNTLKVEINGHKGVMRLYASRAGGGTYSFRTQSILINWFEGNALWTFASYFLSPQQALEAAESIRPVTIR
jgi:hypothetical protein